MAYDYSTQFLEKNVHDVAAINRVYNEGAVLRQEYDTAWDLQRAQFRINNVLRSLAVNYPEQYVTVRKSVRLKTNMDVETRKWILIMYRWDGSVIVGRPPGENTRSTWIEPGIGTLAPREEVMYPTTIEEQEHFEKWRLWLLELPQGTKKVSVRFVDEIQPEFLVGLIADEWKVYSRDPKTLILERA